MTSDGQRLSGDVTSSKELTRLFKHAQTACRRAAIEAYEDAQIRGLCAQGAFEAAMQAIENLKLKKPVLDDEKSVELG